MRLRATVLSALALLVVLAQVAHAQDDQAARMRTALASPERSAENKARDEGRKPIETVQFFGIKTGDTVVDMIAVGGWFTEVLSAAVGPKGKVYMQNPPFAQSSVNGKVDAVVTAMNLHDIYNGFQNQPAGEPAAVELLKSIYGALKPGGTLGLIDHVGVAGQDNAKLHRMLPQQAREAITKAGFTIEAESKLLANAADDHTKGVFDPAVRGHTDQFMIRARKPR